MAAVTPATIVRESLGSTTLLICDIASVTSGATGDTWASGLGNGIIGAWAIANTAGANSCSVSWASGTITINPTSGATGCKLYVLTKT